MKILLDEMYSAALAGGLETAGIQAATAFALGLSGHPDAEVFAAAVAGGYAVLTEDVGDFTRIAAEHIAHGDHHRGLLIALSSRFARRPAGLPVLVAAVKALAHQHIDDSVIYLKRIGAAP